jgi:hypothetical protein
MSQARLLARIRREFQTHPGIAVTLSQARSLWSLEEHSGAEAFEALTAEGFLQRIEGVYLWAEAPVPRFRPRTARRLASGRIQGQV